MAIDIEAFYEQYGPMVLRRCRFLLKNEERAQDAMQETFVKLLTNQDRLTGDYPSSLLFRIATNTCLNIIRGAKRKAEVLGNEELLLNIAAFDETEFLLSSRSLLDHLFKKEKASTREIMVMLYVDKMTLDEVAREIGLSVSGVRKRVREFKARVKGLEELTHAG
jgi:RNA polymerase sigma-70 factor (ECF subfamily)